MAVSVKNVDFVSGKETKKVAHSMFSSIEKQLPNLRKLLNLGKEDFLPSSFGVPYRLSKSLMSHGKYEDAIETMKPVYIFCKSLPKGSRLEAVYGKRGRA